MSSRRARYLQDALSDRHEPAGQCSWPTWALRGGVRGGCSAPWGPYRSHEWVQRRILRAFVESGGDITEEYEVQHLVRYVESALALLPPKTRLAVETAWAADEDASWEWLATSLSLGERSEVSPPRHDREYPGVSEPLLEAFASAVGSAGRPEQTASDSLQDQAA